MDDATGAVGVGGRDGECHAAQVVGADGEMDAAAIERFAAAAGLQGRGLSYAVVSILGPQGSGTYLLQPRHPPLLLLPRSLPSTLLLVQGAATCGVHAGFRADGVVNGFRVSDIQLCPG